MGAHASQQARAADCKGMCMKADAPAVQAPQNGGAPPARVNKLFPSSAMQCFVTRFAVYIFGDAKGQKFSDYIKVSPAYRNPGERAAPGAAAFCLLYTSRRG